MTPTHDHSEQPDIIQLKRGATLVKTQSFGYVQFGMPLNGVVELKALGLQPPQYYVVPSTRFHKKQALTLAELKAPVLLNYLAHRTTTIICTRATKDVLKKVFHLQHQLPQDIDDRVRYYDAMDGNPKPNLLKESSYLQQLMSSDNALESSITFMVFDAQGDVHLNEHCVIKKNALGYVIYEKATELGIYYL